MAYSKDLQDVLQFIDSYWDNIIHDKKDSRGNPHLIPLPHTFITTNTREYSHWTGAMFYWDNFFIFRGLIATKRERIIPGMIDNFIYLFKNYGIIPNASFWAFLDHSQPPFLSSMIFDGYFAIKRRKFIRGTFHGVYAQAWLKRRMNVAKQEYWQVWEDSKKYNHKVEEYNLSKYGDRDVGYYLTSERESGWDMTSRFYNRCNDFLAVDLNAFLHKYEKDFARAARIMKNKKEVDYWENRANQRHQQMKKYMWNEKEGFFFDYDYRHKEQSKFYSLAGFIPLWAKLATYDEAKRVREKLPLFETKYGLTIGAKESLPSEIDLKHIPTPYRYSIEDMLKPKQWDYPHIWSPIEYLTVIGLLRYGFVEDAVRIMKKSVAANITMFKKYGALLEKLDATTGDKPASFWYPSQLGFGWTNAVLYRYVKILDIIEANGGDIYDRRVLGAEPPYSLTNILH